MNLKKLLSTFIFILLSIYYGFSQKNFSKGYFIDNENRKIECFINDLSWKENPTSFEYKALETLEIQQKNISDVKEFGIHDLARYVRTEINIDRSFRDGETEINDRKPNYIGQTVFIEVLIDGPASLYVYKEGKDKWFFFKSGIDNNIEQLIYRKYISKSEDFEEYSLFRQQLKFATDCDNISNDRLEKVQYNETDLGIIFFKYNACKAKRQTSFIGNRDRSLFTFTLRPGLDFNDFSINSNSLNNGYEIRSGFRLGFELEKLFLIHQKRWAFIMEPAIRHIVFEREGEEKGLRALEVPIGLRHYFRPNANSGIFLDASYVLDFTILRNSVTGGIGYKHRSNISVQFKLAQRKNIERAFGDLEGDINIYTFIIGYSF